MWLVALHLKAVDPRQVLDLPSHGIAEQVLHVNFGNKLPS